MNPPAPATTIFFMLFSQFKHVPKCFKTSFSIKVDKIQMQDKPIKIFDHSDIIFILLP